VSQRLGQAVFAFAIVAIGVETVVNSKRWRETKSIIVRSVSASETSRSRSKTTVRTDDSKPSPPLARNCVATHFTVWGLALIFSRGPGYNGPRPSYKGDFVRELRGVICVAAFFAMAVAPAVAPFDSPIALHRYSGFPVTAYVVACAVFFVGILVAFFVASSRNRSDEVARREYQQVLLPGRRATR
jgi:hypothetical protein